MQPLSTSADSSKDDPPPPSSLRSEPGASKMPSSHCHHHCLLDTRLVHNLPNTRECRRPQCLVFANALLVKRRLFAIPGEPRDVGRHLPRGFRKCPLTASCAGRSINPRCVGESPHKGWGGSRTTKGSLALGVCGGALKDILNTLAIGVSLWGSTTYMANWKLDKPKGAAKGPVDTGGDARPRGDPKTATKNLCFMRANKDANK